MVKVREGLPLTDGNTTYDDSASLTAKMANANTHKISLERVSGDADAEHGHARKHSATDLHPHQQLSQDNRIKSDLQNMKDSKKDNILNRQEIDEDAWLEKVADRIEQRHLCKLSTAIKVIKKLDGIQETQRSNDLMTGIGTTDILTYIYQDEDALVAAMLYRSARKGILSLEAIEEEFGKGVSTLVADTLSMGRLSDAIENNQLLDEQIAGNQNDQLTNIYSMLISVTNDVRVVMIKLAERTFAMRELSFSDETRQKRVANEVLSIYAPIAHRLGIATIKWELEDLCFSFLAPYHYKRIAKMLAEKRSEREDYIQRVNENLVQALRDVGIEAEVSGRVKHIYSIYKKMKLKTLTFDQLYDIRALRVMVNTQAECYHALGIVHGLWRHIPEQFDDYITNPKANGYRSLHTAVIAENKSLEVQIRTHEMHFEAELGMCAHVNYKEGGKSDVYLNEKISSLRQLLSMNSDKVKAVTDPKKEAVAVTPEVDDNDNIEVDDEGLVDFGEFKRIYIFTRDGEIIELPKGATVLDCAYYIHTQVGNRAQAARVNQRFVPLTYQLKTGEQVEIITKSSREPNRDWLVPSSGYIHTSRARSKLRQWFNRLDREKNIEFGRQTLTKELDRLSVQASKVDLKQYTNHFHVNKPDDILAGLANGDISIHQLINQISKDLNLEPDEEVVEVKTEFSKKSYFDSYSICIDGLDNIAINIAKCCSPVQGEPISGFITMSKGVSVHHRDCVEYCRLVEREPERQIDAKWYASQGKAHPVAVYIEAYDRRGLLLDLTKAIDNLDINICKIESLNTSNDLVKMKLFVEVTGLSQLSKVLQKLEQQAGVLRARRAVS